MDIKIVYFVSSSGSNPVKDFIDSLEKKQKIKIFHIFKLILEYGPLSIPQHIQKLKSTELWEIRVLGKDNIRILFVIPIFEYILLVHGFVKKINKTPLKEIETAINRYVDWKNRKISIDK